MQLLKTRAALIFFLALVAITQAFSNEPIDNLLLKADTIIDIEKKTESLINTSKRFEKINLTLSLDAITQAHKLSAKSKNNELIALCNHQIGIVLSKKNKTDEAITNLKKALAYYEESGDKVSIALILVDIGNAYSNNSQFKKSLIFYNSALAGFTEISDSLGIVICYTYLGQSNNALGNDNSAIIFFKDAISIAGHKNFNYYLALNYLNVSKVQLELGLTDNILSQINLALEIAKHEPYKNLEADAYILFNSYYSTIGNKSEATKQLLKFIDISDSLNKIKSTELENFLIELTDVADQPGEKSKTKLVFWLLIVVLVIIILFLLFKIKKQRTLHFNNIEKCASELEAFNSNIGDLNETIEQKTKDRILEIDQETINNNNNVIALNNSIEKLYQINNLKDLFLSKISHEIRTPLNGILGFSSILESELALLEDNTLFEFANSISQSGSSLVTLLNNILDISRLDSNNMMLDIKKLNTNELIQGVVDNYQTEASLKGLKLIFASKVIPDIYTDNQLFSKILSLILSNSVKFTEKGFIKISHDYDEQKNMINIFIKDTGIGIDKVYINQVFEPFRQESLGYSTSYQGAGLGLPLAKKMSVKLDGDIDIESEKGSGTTIILNFPAYKTKKETTLPLEIKEPKKDTKKEALPWETLSVLVVEDDSMNQMLYRKMLKKARFLEIAKDGKTALNIVEKQIKNNNFQLVLMDINLPAPWDGISLMKEIRNRWAAYKDIPFIAQTAYAISGNRRAMMDEGFDDYITKPIIKSTLIESIKSVIDNKHLT